mgnify:CR=1 FL=1
MKRYADLIGNYKIIEIKNSIDNKMIGRFSALAVTSIVNITSYYNGIKYSYLMYKNGTGINIDKLEETPGDYKNGVEISVSLSKDSFGLHSFMDAINNLVYFKKLHIENRLTDSFSNYAINRFNNRTFKEFSTFCDCPKIVSGHYGTKIRVGNVLYDVNDAYISDFCSDTHATLKFNVGELDVTPNREQLQYTERTKQILKLRLEECKKEFLEVTKTHAEQAIYDFKTLLSFADMGSPIPLFNDCRLSTKKEDFFKCGKVKIGEDVVPNDFLDIVKVFKHCYIGKSEFNFNTRKGINTKEYFFKSFFSLPIYIQKESRLKEVTKEYYDSINEGPYIIIKESSAKNLLKRCLKIIKSSDFGSSGFNALRYCIKHLGIKTISNDNVPASFIENYKKQIKGTASKRINATNDYITCRVYCGSGGYRIANHTLAFFKQLNQTVIYGENTREDDDYRGLASMLGSYSSGIKILTLKKEDILKIKDLKDYISIEEYLSKKRNPLAKWATGRYLYKLFYSKYYDRNTYISTLPHPFRQRIAAQMHNSGDSRYDIVNKIYNSYVENKWLDYAKINYCVPTDKQLLVSKIKEKLNQQSEDIINTILIQAFGIVPDVTTRNLINITKLINQIKNESV